MNRNKITKNCILFRMVVICLFLLLCCSLVFASDVFATSADTKNTPIELSEEEQDYINRTGEITIGCPIQNCPLLFKNKKTGQLEGITIDILDMISEQTGLTFRYQELPSGDITYQVLQQLQVDMVAGVEFNEINQQSIGIAMSEPYLHSQKVFVCKKGDVFQPNDEMVIAINTGSQTLESVILQQYPMFQILYCDSTEDALSAVLSGKADAVLQNQYTIERILSKPIYEDLRIVATASIGDSQCLASIVPISEKRENVISDDTALLLSIINKGIAGLDENTVSFVIIKETSENTYRFNMWDIIYRYRISIIIAFISLLAIIVLVHKNRVLHKKHEEHIAEQQRAKELADINERMREQQLLLIDSLKRAEEGIHAKSSFLFNVSHDIRTPMNAILGFAEIAHRNIGDEEKLADYIEKIQISGKQLLSLIDNVLDMAKIENEKVTLTEESCNLEECIEKVRDTLRTEIDEKDISLQIDMSSVKHKWVYCDSMRLNQILFQLVSNAVKFSKQSGNILITVSDNLCSIQEYASYEIRIKDTGIGMNEEFLSHIFEPFEREHTSTISQTQGIGLGMSITKTLIDLMGGTIQVSSEQDKGTEIVLKFTFKLQEQVKPQQQPYDDTVAEVDFSGKRLLLVEDNELNMEIAKELLSVVGFTVETAQNGQIAVEMVRNSSAGYYDAILMDIQMPVMNGYVASREIRSLENKALAEIPIIALTANTFDEDKMEAMSNGMNAYVAKPIEVNVLYSVLKDILE